MKLHKINDKIEKAWQENLAGYPADIINRYPEIQLKIAKNWFTLGYYRAIKEILLYGLPTSQTNIFISRID